MMLVAAPIQDYMRAVGWKIEGSKAFPPTIEAARIMQFYGVIGPIGPDGSAKIVRPLLILV